jgi:hypothetical protein
MHVIGTHTDEQLCDPDVREPGHLQHAAEHPRFTEERVMRRRARAADGQMFESFEEHTLRRR